MLTREEVIKLIDDGHCDDSDGTYFCADCKYKLMSVIDHFLEDNQKTAGIRLNYIDILSGHLTEQPGEMIKMERGVLSKTIELLKQQPEQPRRKSIHTSQTMFQDGSGNSFLLIVTTCDDGTQWKIRLSEPSKKWDQLPPIPQENEK